MQNETAKRESNLRKSVATKQPKREKLDLSSTTFGNDTHETYGAPSGVLDDTSDAIAGGRPRVVQDPSAHFDRERSRPQCIEPVKSNQQACGQQTSEEFTQDYRDSDDSQRPLDDDSNPLDTTKSAGTLYKRHAIDSHVHHAETHGHTQYRHQDVDHSSSLPSQSSPRYTRGYDSRVMRESALDHTKDPLEHDSQHDRDCEQHHGTEEHVAALAPLKASSKAKNPSEKFRIELLQQRLQQSPTLPQGPTDFSKDARSFRRYDATDRHVTHAYDRSERDLSLYTDRNILDERKHDNRDEDNCLCSEKEFGRGMKCGDKLASDHGRSRRGVQHIGAGRSHDEKREPRSLHRHESVDYGDRDIHDPQTRDKYVADRVDFGTHEEIHRRYYRGRDRAHMPRHGQDTVFVQRDFHNSPHEHEDLGSRVHRESERRDLYDRNTRHSNRDKLSALSAGGAFEHRFHADDGNRYNPDDGHCARLSYHLSRCDQHTECVNRGTHFVSNDNWRQPGLRTDHRSVYNTGNNIMETGLKGNHKRTQRIARRAEEGGHSVGRDTSNQLYAADRYGPNTARKHAPERRVHNRQDTHRDNRSERHTSHARHLGVRDSNSHIQRDISHCSLGRRSDGDVDEGNVPKATLGYVRHVDRANMERAQLKASVPFISLHGVCFLLTKRLSCIGSF